MSAWATLPLGVFAFLGGLPTVVQSDARRAAEARGCDMTRPFSVAFKQKMVQRLTGKDAVSAMQLARETGVRQQNLSRWLQEARSLLCIPTMADA